MNKFLVRPFFRLRNAWEVVENFINGGSRVSNDQIAKLKKSLGVNCSKEELDAYLVVFFEWRIDYASQFDVDIIDLLSSMYQYYSLGRIVDATFLLGELFEILGDKGLARCEINEIASRISTTFDGNRQHLREAAQKLMNKEQSLTTETYLINSKKNPCCSKADFIVMILRLIDKALK